jgi:hypothetical protein
MATKEQMLQQVKDAKDAVKMEEAYNKAMPMPDTSFPLPAKKAEEKKPADKKMPPAKPYAKGGSVSSASKRADGCAVKGKTKGTMITMKGGGYAC